MDSQELGKLEDKLETIYKAIPQGTRSIPAISVLVYVSEYSNLTSEILSNFAGISEVKIIKNELPTPYHKMHVSWKLDIRQNILHISIL